MPDKEPETVLELLAALKEFIKERNKKFPVDDIMERVNYEKARKMDRRERFIFADALDEIAIVLENESVFFTKTRVSAREGHFTKPHETRDTGVYLAFERIERALNQAADAVRLDAQTLRNLK